MPDSTRDPKRSWPQRIAAAPVRAYKYAISPMLPHACRFEPTCACYMIEAIEAHGALKGLGLGTRRILKCHPITLLGGSSGFDPVPPKRRQKVSVP
jgi:putative membrane protein insertion efficiency factor